MDVFFSIFVTYTEQRKERMFPNLKENVERDLQLVALAALADIMPMKNENRIFVKSALETINSGKIRPGLLELAARGNLLGKKITSTDLSWSIIPVLNAAGRLGKSNLFLRAKTLPCVRQKNLPGNNGNPFRKHNEKIQSPVACSNVHGRRLCGRRFNEKLQGNKSHGIPCRIWKRFFHKLWRTRRGGRLQFHRRQA